MAARVNGNRQLSDLREALLKQRELECTACLRKTVLKTTACCCLPISFVGHCLICANNECDPRRGHYVDRAEIPYCETTTHECMCAGVEIWHSALPPKGYSEMSRLACDPCVFVECLQEGDEDDINHYLLPPERQAMARPYIEYIKDAFEKRLKASTSKKNDTLGLKQLVSRGVAVDKVTKKVMEFLKKEEPKPYKYIEHFPAVAPKRSSYSSTYIYIPAP